MEREEIQNDELDRLLDHVLTSDDTLKVPLGLSDKILIKIEKRLLMKELILELFLKLGIVLGSLALLAGIFIGLKGTAVFTPLRSLLMNNWQLVTSTLLIVFITVLIDQIGLKFFAGNKREISLKM